MKKSKVLIISGIIVSVFICIIGLSYAWMQAIISGTTNVSKIDVEMGILRINYVDTALINDTKQSPGWTKQKTFSIENTGNLTTNYNILWEYLNNTLINKQDLVYSFTSVGAGGQTLSETPVPSSGNNIIIKSNIPIAPGIKHTYTVTFNYKDTSTDQSSDMGKVFGGKLTIAEYRP
ncbi:MAG: hypothetical protein RR228_00705 [Bacilli bacterium]